MKDDDPEIILFSISFTSTSIESGRCKLNCINLIFFDKIGILTDFLPLAKVAMASFVAPAVAVAIQRVVSKIRDIKELPEECRKLADVVSLLQPIYDDLEKQFLQSNHRRIMEMLQKGLKDAEDVVDYIHKHPKYAALRSGKYRKKLEDAVESIDIWIMRVQPLTGGETLRKIEALKASLEVQPENTAHRVVDEVSPLFQKVIEKMKPSVMPKGGLNSN